MCRNTRKECHEAYLYERQGEESKLEAVRGRMEEGLNELINYSNRVLRLTRVFNDEEFEGGIYIRSYDRLFCVSKKAM